MVDGVLSVFKTLSGKTPKYESAGGTAQEGEILLIFPVVLVC